MKAYYVLAKGASSADFIKEVGKFMGDGYAPHGQFQHDGEYFLQAMVLKKVHQGGGGPTDKPFVLMEGKTADRLPIGVNEWHEKGYVVQRDCGMVYDEKAVMYRQPMVAK